MGQRTWAWRVRALTMRDFLNLVFYEGTGWQVANEIVNRVLAAALP